MGARRGAWRQILLSNGLFNRRGQQRRYARPHPDLDTQHTPRRPLGAVGRVGTQLRRIFTSTGTFPPGSPDAEANERMRSKGTDPVALLRVLAASPRVSGLAGAVQRPGSRRCCGGQRPEDVYATDTSWCANSPARSGSV